MNFMKEHIKAILQEPSFPVPLPMPDIPDTRIWPVTDTFTEVHSGCLEADLSVPINAASADRRLFLQLSRVGCRASLTISGPDGNTISCSHYGSFTDWQLELTPLLTGFSSLAASGTSVEKELRSGDGDMAPSFSLTESSASDANAQTIRLHAVLTLEADCRTTSPYQKAGILGGIRLVQTPAVYFSDLRVRSRQVDSDDDAGNQQAVSDCSWQFLISCPLLAADSDPSVSASFDSANTSIPTGTLISDRAPLSNGASHSAETSMAAKAAKAPLSDNYSIFIEVQTPEGLPVCSRFLSLEQAAAEEAALSVPSGFVRLWNPEAPYCFRIICNILKDGIPTARCERMAGLCKIEKQNQTVLFNGTPLKLRGLAYREPLPAEGHDPAADLELFCQAHINYLRSLYYPFSEEFLSLCDQYGILVEQSAPVEEVGQSLPAFQNAPALRPLFQNQFREMVLAGRSHPSVLLWCLGHNCVWGDQFCLGKQLIRSLDPDRLINFHLPMTIPQDEWIPDVWTVDYSAWNLPADVCYDQMVIFHTQGADNPIGYALGKAEDLKLPVLHDAYALVPVYDRDALEAEDGIHEFWGESMKRSWNNIRRTPGALGGAVMAAVDEDGSFSPALRDFCYGILDSSHQPKPEYWHVAMTYSEDPFSIRKTPQEWNIQNSRLHASLNPQTGLLTGVSLDGKPIICEGPFLNTGRFFLEPWELISLRGEPADRGLLLIISGRYGASCAVTFQLLFGEDGSLHTSCRIDEVGRPMPHQVKSGIGLDPGGLNEYGIRYVLPASADTLSWSRNALWNSYPADHIGRPCGTASKACLSDFTSRKANLTDASISSSETQTTLRLHPEPGQSIRLSLSADPHCVLNMKDEFTTPAADAALDAARCQAIQTSSPASISFDGPWYAVSDRAGQEYPDERMAKDRGASCRIRFYGTGLTVYGTTDRIRGLCDVWIDGKPAARRLSQHTPAVQMPAMSRGYEKRFHRVLFHIDGLAAGLHECRITVLGEKEPASQETWISIDSVEILHPEYPSRVSMTVSRDYNYPRLTQGNYMRPAVMMQAGDILTCRLSVQCHSTHTKGESSL